MIENMIAKLKQEHAALDAKKVTVIGDIAFDRTFLCHVPSPGFHATHGRETIFDADEDDRGSVGSANTTCLFHSSFGVRTVLLTTIGDDDEGKRVEEIVNAQRSSSRLMTISGSNTISRYRFFVKNETAGSYDLKFRIDKEPDFKRVGNKSHEEISRPDFLDWFCGELADCDALVFNDTEKGFLTENVLTILGKGIDDENKSRREKGGKDLIVVVDPKNTWNKFSHLPGALIKANLKESRSAAGMDESQAASEPELLQLFRRLNTACDARFPNIIVTLGGDGAALLQIDCGGSTLYNFPAIKSPYARFKIATHCGDIFTSALTLALILDEDIFTSVTFANYAASLQFSQPTGKKIGREEIVADENINHFLKNYRPHST